MPYLPYLAWLAGGLASLLFAAISCQRQATGTAATEPAPTDAAGLPTAPFGRTAAVRSTTEYRFGGRP